MVSLRDRLSRVWSRDSQASPAPPSLTPMPKDLPHGDQLEHFLEQYKIFVETEERLVSRRQEENRFFLSVNALVLTVLSFLLKEGISDKAAWVGIFLLAGAGLTLCYAWFRIIDSYKTLNQAKFAVINRFEEHLPARMFGAEWDDAEARDYQPFTKIERHVPFVFGLLHGVGAVVALGGIVGVVH
ncbi:MAG TPA: hypothetical protein VLK37_04925 [Solirubrobacterales bacterium]|nr:hypothetical protein [Solirubrobacterales bacterium]